MSNSLAPYKPPSRRTEDLQSDISRNRNGFGNIDLTVKTELGRCIDSLRDALSRGPTGDATINEVLRQLSVLQFPLKPALTTEVGAVLSIVLKAGDISLATTAIEDLFRFFISATTARQLELSDAEAEGLVSIALQYLIDHRPSDAKDPSIHWGGAQIVLSALRILLERFPNAGRYGVWILKALLLYSDLRVSSIANDELSFLSVQLETTRLITLVLELLITIPTESTVASSQAPPSRKCQGSQNTHISTAADELLAFFRTGQSASLSGRFSAPTMHWTGFKNAVLFHIESDLGLSAAADVTDFHGLSIPRLYEIVDRIMMCCAESMIKSLHAAIHKFTTVAMQPRSSTDTNVLLCSCLDWISSVAAAVRSGVLFDKDNSTTLRDVDATIKGSHLPHALRPTTLTFTPHLPSLVIALRTMFQRLIPGMLNEIELIKPTTRTPSSSQTVIGSDPYFYSQVGFVCSSLNLLGSVASSNSGEFLRHWPLFLTDSGAIDVALFNYVHHMIYGNNVAPRKNIQFSHQLSCPKFQSTVYRCLLLGLAEPYAGSSNSFGSLQKNSDINKYKCGLSLVRNAASQTIRGLLKGLPLKKWFVLTGSGNSSRVISGSVGSTQNQSQKAVEAVTKILAVLTVVLMQEEDEATLTNHIEILRILLPQLPLATLYNMDERGVVRAGTAAVSPALERAVETSFRCVLRMSLLEEGMPPILEKVVDDSSIVPVVAAPPEELPDNTPDILNTKVLLLLLQQLEPNMPPIIGTEQAWPLVVADGRLTSIFAVAAATVAPAVNNVKNRGIKHRCVQAAQFLTEFATDISAPLNALADAARHTEIDLEGNHRRLYSSRLLQLCAAICGLTPVQKGAPDAATSYGLALKTLIISLLQSCGARFVDVTDSRFVSFLCIIHRGPSATLRMMASQLVGIILNTCRIETPSESDSNSIAQFRWNLYNAPNPAFLVPGMEELGVEDGTNNPRTHILKVRDVVAMIAILLNGCGDDDHMVRGHAASSIGLLEANCWMVCKSASTSDGLEHKVPKQDIQTDIKRTLDVRLLAALLALCVDSVGTVRTLAHKSLGEAVLAGALHNISIDALETNRLVENILVKVRTGCVDSKLAVRLQALWSLGNLLILLLPYRLVVSVPQQLGLMKSPHFQNFNHEGMIVASWVDTDIWKTLATLCSNVMNDSDKLMASMTRCLGVLCVGLVADCKACATLINTLIHQVLMENTPQGYPEGIAVLPPLPELATAIQSRTQKLLMALCTGLGLVGWALLPLMDHCNSEAQRESYISIIRTVTVVQCQLMNLAGDSVRMQAARAMVSIAYANNKAPSVYFADDIFGPDIKVMLLDTILKGMSQVRTTTGFKEKKKKLKKTNATSDSTLSGNSPGGRKLIITKAAPQRSGGSYIERRVRSGSWPAGRRRDLPEAPAELDHIGPKGLTPKLFKPLPSAITNAISVRRRPEAQDGERNLLRLYAVLLWTISSNRSNKSVVAPDVNSPSRICPSQCILSNESEVSNIDIFSTNAFN